VEEAGEAAGGPISQGGVLDAPEATGGVAAVDVEADAGKDGEGGGGGLVAGEDDGAEGAAAVGGDGAGRPEVGVEALGVGAAIPAVGVGGGGVGALLTVAHETVAT